MSNAQENMLSSIAKRHRVRGTVEVYDGDMTVDVYVCQLKDIPGLVSTVSWFFQRIGATTMGDALEAETQVAALLNNPATALQLIADASDRVFSTGSMLCSLSEEEFGELPLNDALAILAKEYEVNKGFFIKSVLPVLRPMLNSSNSESDEQEKQHKSQTPSLTESTT